MPKFCPSCGKNINKGTFCEDCKPEHLNYKIINIKLCPSKRYFYKGKWTKFEDLKKEVKKIFETNLKKSVEIIDLEYEYLLEKPGLEKQEIAHVKIEDEDYSLPINFFVTTSPHIAKVGSGYFEGILQVRNARQEVKQFIKNILKKDNIYINEVVEKKESIDYYFVSKQKQKNVAAKIIKHFSGYIDQNPQLFSRNHQTSKDIYRLNTLVQIPKFKQKDVIKLDDKPHIVTSIGKTNSAIDIEYNKKKTFKYNPEKNYEKFKKYNTKIIKLEPDITALNPKSFQEMKTKNLTQKKLEINQNVKGIIFKDIFYIIN